MNAAITELFTRAGCVGQLCVQSLDGAQELAVDALLRLIWTGQAGPQAACARCARS
jgi:hypothetical protein